MKRLLFGTFLVSMFFMAFGFVRHANAQNLPVKEGRDDIENIYSFDVSINANKDNSIFVNETIVYETGPTERHGIYRDVYPYSSDGRKINIENISVKDEMGKSQPFTVSSYGKYLRIKIGENDKTFRGQRMYVVSYTAENAISQLRDVDEIYWNVTGNDWQIPIYFARAVVTLPDGVNASQTACYFGKTGSREKCSLSASNASTYEFSAPKVLGPEEGLTVAVGTAKGFFIPYTTLDLSQGLWQKYASWMIGILLPLITFYAAWKYWSKNGRDPKGAGVIVPQYDVPDQLTPLEIEAIVKQRVSPQSISAEIIYLATKGYLRINEIEKKTLFIIKSTDYELVKIKEPDNELNLPDTHLLTRLFPGDKKTVVLSTLKNSFYKDSAEVLKMVPDLLLKKGYYKNLGRMKAGKDTVVLFLIFVMFIAMAFGSTFAVIATAGNPLALVAGILLSIIILVVAFILSPAKTEKCVATKEYILGLKDYLKIAEKDRLLFHNAPEKKPEIFEKLLPYAMVLGVAKIWAKEFEDVYLAPPQWYSSTHAGMFNAVIFNESLSNFNSFVVANVAAAPGGSGGGGFSGGGGGGGGGGGW